MYSSGSNNLDTSYDGGIATDRRTPKCHGVMPMPSVWHAIRSSYLLQRYVLDPLVSCCCDSCNSVGRTCVVCCSKGPERYCRRGRGSSRLSVCSLDVSSHRPHLRLDLGDDEHAGFLTPGS